MKGVIMTNIFNRLQEHLNSVYPDINDYFFLALQGSQNYGISDTESDIDTKALTIPSFKDIVKNSKPQNKVFMMENEEHCDLKDMREYFKIMRKSNINFVEVIFTKYALVNSKYKEEYDYLINNNERIARLNPSRAVKCMAGMAREKFHALCHEYPSRMYYIETFGFDPKQLSHLVRIEYFTEQYINGASYKDCIYPRDEETRELLLLTKRNALGLTKEQAESIAADTFS